MRSARLEQLDELFARIDRVTEEKDPVKLGRATAELAIAKMTGRRRPYYDFFLNLCSIPLAEEPWAEKIRNGALQQLEGARAVVGEHAPKVPGSLGNTFSKSSMGKTNTFFKPIGCGLVQEVPLVFMERHVFYGGLASELGYDDEPDEESQLPFADFGVIAVNATAPEKLIKGSLPEITAKRILHLSDEAKKQGFFTS